MINIAITAGGTIENIDEVRKIINASTGKLGTFICQEVLDYFNKYKKHEDFKIHYILSKTALQPIIDNKDLKHIIFYEITDTQSVADTIELIFKNYEINYFIHSMAISDFTASHMIPINQLAKEINEKLSHTVDRRCEIIEEILRKPESALDKREKVSSKSDILLTLKRTPKIISLVKSFDNHVFLVGFKLLKNVTEEKLLEAANILAIKNHCDLVLANDLQHIDGSHHIGLLIENGTIINRYLTKEDIAKGIIFEMFKRRPMK